MRETAASRLEYGDEVNRRLAEGAEPGAIAVTDRRSPQVVSKAAWLARTYDADTRGRLGPAVLNGLTASHLEVVAALGRDARISLLRQAHEAGLSVRRVKEVAGMASSAPAAPGAAPGVRVLGNPAELASACAAAKGYAAWDDRALLTLLGGPNGAVIRELAKAGLALARRIEEVVPLGCAAP